MVSLCWQVCRSPDLNRLVPLADEMPLAAPLLPVVPFDQRWNCERKLFQERQGWFLLTSPGRRVAVFYVGLRGNGHALCLTETARQVLQLPASAILHDSWQPVRTLLLSNGFPFQAQDAAVYSLDIQVQSLGPPCVTVRVVGATEVVLKARRPRRSAKARMDDSCTEASLSDGANAEALMTLMSRAWTLRSTQKLPKLKKNQTLAMSGRRQMLATPWRTQKMFSYACPKAHMWLWNTATRFLLLRITTRRVQDPDPQFPKCPKPSALSPKGCRMENYFHFLPNKFQPCRISQNGSLPGRAAWVMTFVSGCGGAGRGPSLRAWALESPAKQP